MPNPGGKRKHDRTSTIAEAMYTKGQMEKDEIRNESMGKIMKGLQCSARAFGFK